MEKIILDQAFIGKQYPTITFDVEIQTALLFAKATGQDDPIYFDDKAAKKGIERGKKLKINKGLQDKSNKFFLIT